MVPIEGSEVPSVATRHALATEPRHQLRFPLNATIHLGDVVLVPMIGIRVFALPRAEGRLPTGEWLQASPAVAGVHDRNVAKPGVNWRSTTPQPYDSDVVQGL